jgi:two-component system chemotaxis response regulator CheB
MKTGGRQFQAIVLGVSTGGVEALKRLLPALPATFPLPLLAVIHLARESDDGLAQLLDTFSAVRVKEADEGESLQPGVVYFAPANYHLLVEKDKRLALSTDPPVHFARPSIDVLFESAAAAFGRALIGIVLTGAANDGAAGLARIKRAGGYAIVQDPDDAEMDSMPRSALELTRPDAVVRLAELADLLLSLAAGTE